MAIKDYTRGIDFQKKVDTIFSQLFRENGFNLENEQSLILKTRRKETVSAAPTANTVSDSIKSCDFYLPKTSQRTQLSSLRKPPSSVRKRIRISRSKLQFSIYQISYLTLASMEVSPRRPCTCAQPVMPGRTCCRTR